MRNCKKKNQFNPSTLQSFIVNCLSFSKDGLIFASGSEDCKVKIWEFIYKTEKGSFSEHHKGVNCLCFMMK